MTNIDKAIKIMNSVLGYDRFKHSKGDKFIADTKTDVGYFPDEFINLLITKLYTYTDYFSTLPVPIAKEYMNSVLQNRKKRE